MNPPVEPARFDAAARRFRAFFTELDRAFVERHDLVNQVALALLSREHVLMTGPPGTAKSGLATAVLGRILDESTGRHSLFARQFTESTVQTDLVGPIDFKTLMSTGRTEHFTDQGMLGAVHAFLDEVLDGRDMLLRTTLNVLHERELKEGTRTTQGQIECALMTTNRYLAEVLDGSRETLLAFVDRIAFVSFVPKGFAEPHSLERVLRAQIGGTRPPSLSATLTIQDLDALQAAADGVHVPDPICASLVALLDFMDADLQQAARADPTFTPTRYLSTRTAVRMGRILRAVCIYDRIMCGNDRPFEVTHADLPMLRLSLLLSGPGPQAVEQLLARETDPRERRQLSIMRTEREIFERAWARVQRPDPQAVNGPSPGQAKVLEIASEVKRALPASNAEALVSAAVKLSSVADTGRDGAREATALLESTVSALVHRALRAGFTAGAGPESEVTQLVAELASLADGLERASGPSRPTARWLRGRAMALLDEAAVVAPASMAASFDATGPTSLDATGARADALLEPIERLWKLRSQLRAQGAEEPDPAASQRAVERAVQRVEDELVDLWDGGFRAEVSRALGADMQLATVLATLSPVLRALDEYGRRVAALGGDPVSLKARVAGPRLLPFVSAAFERIETSDRLAFIEQVGGLVGELEKGDLARVIPSDELLTMAAAALVRCEKGARVKTSYTADVEGYRAMRQSEPRISLAYTAVEIAMRVTGHGASPRVDAHKGLAGVLARVPDDLRRELAALDLARVGRAVELLARWWATVERPARDAVAQRSDGAIATVIERVKNGRFFHVTRDEGAFVRFALEARVIGEVFPEHEHEAKALRGRVLDLEASTSEVLTLLRRAQADLRWADALASPTELPTSR